VSGQVVVVTSGKGGVGKTTVVANIGTGLALSGQKVVLVDADIGLRNLDVVMGLENRILYDIVDVVEGRTEVRKALIRDKRVEGLSLLPASQTRDKTAVTEEQMKCLCDNLKEEFDYVLIDCPAGIEQGFQNAVAGADGAIIVSIPEVSALRDADKVVGLLEGAGLTDPYLVVNRIRMDMVRRGDMLDVSDMTDILGRQVRLLGIVPDDQSIIVSTNRGEPAVLDPKSRAGQAFRNIVRRLLGEEVEFMDLNEGGLVARLMKLVGLAK